MWKTSARNALLCASLLSFYLASLPPCSYAAEPTVTMTVAEFNELSQIVKRQESRLNLLEAQYETQMETSTEQSKELTQVKAELTGCRSQLTAAKNELAKANVSLATAKQTIEELNRSLTECEKEMDSLRRQRNLAVRQRNLWSTIAIPSALYSISKLL